MSRGSKVAIRIEMHPNGVRVVDNVGGQALWGRVGEFDVVWSAARLDPRAEPERVRRSRACGLAALLKALTRVWFEEGDIPVLTWHRGKEGCDPARANLYRMVASHARGSGRWRKTEPKDLRGEDAVVIEA